MAALTEQRLGTFPLLPMDFDCHASQPRKNTHRLHIFFPPANSIVFFLCGIHAWISPSGVFSGAGPWNVCLSATCHLHGKGKRRSGLWLFVFWCRMRSLPNSKHTVTVIQIHWHNFRTYGTPEKSSVEVSKYQHDPELMAWSIHFLLPSWTWGLSN